MPAGVLYIVRKTVVSPWGQRAKGYAKPEGKFAENILMDPLDNQRRVDYNPYNLLERLVIDEGRSDAIPMLPMLLPLIHLNNITTFLGGIDDESLGYRENCEKSQNRNRLSGVLLSSARKGRLLSNQNSKVKRKIEKIRRKTPADF